MSAKQPVKIVDPTTDANELAVTSRGSAPIEGPVAEAAAATGVQPLIIGGVDAAGDARRVLINSDGSLAVSTGASGTPNVEFGDTGQIAALASADVDTADIAAATHQLKQVTVAGEQPFFFTVSKVEDGVATALTGQMHGHSGATVHYVPQIDMASTGGAAGLDAWRVSVSNNDNNQPATFYVTFEFLTLP